jgi:hypothetical protein
MTKRSSQPCETFVHSERLGDIVFGTEINLAAVLIPHHVRCASASQVLRMSTIKKRRKSIWNRHLFFVGINVSKAHLNIALHLLREERVLPHTATSIATLVTDLEAIHPTVIA